MRRLLLVGLAGCATNVGTGPYGAGIAACAAASPYDDAVFAALTASEWDSGCDGGGGGLAPTCTRIQLGADGEFSWLAVSDYVERDQAGRWAFSARSSTAGIVCLGTGAVLPFELAPGLLHLGGAGYSPGAALAATGSRDGLSTVISDPLYPQLVAHAWTKTNDFDLYRLPQDFTLARDGTFSAAYRDGTCTHGGTWGLDVVPRTGGNATLFVSSADANSCDLRSGGSNAQLPASDDEVHVDGARLVFFDSAYRATNAADTRPWFSFDAYGTTVATSAYLDRNLSASAATTLSLDFANQSTSGKTLTSFAVLATPMVATTDGYTSAGATATLATLDLGGTSLAPGDHVAATAAIAPGTAGDVELEIDTTYSDATQSYAGREFYFATVAP